MKLKSRFYLKDREDEERVRPKFLWWPRCFNGGHWRWLERVSILERITRMDVGGSCERGNYKWVWREIGFAD